MFKAASSNAVSRDRRLVTESRENTAGIDPSVFRREKTEKESLISQKLLLQQKSGKLKAQIALAKKRHSLNMNGQVAHAIVLKWELERSHIGVEIAEVEKRLADLKFEARMAAADAMAKNEKKEDGFDRVFKQMAKEMLAGPVYDRIVLATIHRLGERGVSAT